MLSEKKYLTNNTFILNYKENNLQGILYTKLSTFFRIIRPIEKYKKIKYTTYIT